jgi:hypothetical protein
MENIPRLPTAERHPIFADKTIAEVNRLRSQEIDISRLNEPSYAKEQIKLDVYFNVQEVVEGKISQEDAFARIFKLMEIYAKVEAV